jgi:sec-independent protein translocase protein TatA
MGLDNPVHLMLLLVVLLLVFGAKRLPEMGRSLGHGLRGFKDAISGEVTVHHLDMTPAQAPAAAETLATEATTGPREPTLVP